MNDELVLETKNLKKSFGKFQALRNVNLQLHKGEVLGFIGPNGAGKSTTIRVILGLIKATGGSATVFGKDVWKDSVAIHKNLSYVPGDVYLWPNLTGGQTIDLLLHMSGQKHTARTDQLIKEFKLDTSKKNRTYSKGNRQKVALVAAFSTDVSLYIFDEPTSGLDPLNEVIFQQHVAELKKAGKSVLLSSHILSEVEKMCDTIAIIREGNVIEAGSLESMQHLTRNTVAVRTKKPLDELQKAGGVYQLKFNDASKTTAEFSVDSDQIGNVMDLLSAKTIVQLKTTPPTLEDLFLRYYQSADEQKGGD
ncbi:MAG: ABC transporter ATP-binding protein [Lentilactobacillus hilgardii]|uniref:ATP-binding cassette domain-containing protein n=1 Tax=Lentilactobacillus hilgardii TaxID=1588 RepID=A0A6P1E1V4_LENHI|nr:ABC transporter ATP-binding protein [Lentilactobacillus hilgardii]RRG12095.1 MAG: ABC transporter ATP-binding protein [Lactobacillus sp.]EEI71983.1 ABC transporter, ATP-binding protein [Lentilactobacillus hilgardii ATCC 27305]MBZ2200206.1 ABC transporter ATP-binding protein [Lentilactobacillus hilgardii]MBZ2203247.1 ABC transporter ATP-binding protein [Lentilactobacillus hilgardii]MCT3391016.1 ABC transporter ATP-binding protein [Lentilactobacillus hilgardii]